MRVPLPLTILAVIALAAACGGATPTTAPKTAGAPTGAPTSAATATATGGGGGAGGGSDPNNVECNSGNVGSDVSIVNFSFQPATIAADSDDTVHWTNNDSTDHTVTFDNGKDCGTLAGGDSLTVLFKAAGTYTYHCTIHSSMKGTVTVG